MYSGERRTVGKRTKLRVLGLLQVICLVAAPAACFAQAQESSRRPLIECLPASYVHESASITNYPAVRQSYRVASEDASTSKVQRCHAVPTSGDRWETFETEFGIGQRDPSLIKASMENAKYELDRTLFGMQEIVHDVQDACTFDRELRGLGHSPSSTKHHGESSVPIPYWDTMERARLQSDIDLNMAAGRAFIGLRLSLPLGE